MIRNRLRSLSIALLSTTMTLGSVLGSSVSLWAADKNVAAAHYPVTHHIRTVFVILMENHNWTGDGNMDIKGNAAAPYINKTLLPMASHAERYYNPRQSSQPSQLPMAGGGH